MIYDFGLWFPKTSKKFQFHKFVIVQVKDTHLGMMVSHLDSTVSVFLKVTSAEFTTGRPERWHFFITTTFKIIYCHSFPLKKL